MNKYKKLVSNTAILGIGTFSSKLLVFLMVRLYTGILTREEYGTAELISQTANLLLPIVSAGICEAVFRFTMDKALDKRQVFSTGLFTILSGSVILLLCSPLLGMIPGLGSYAWLIVCYVIASCLHSLCAQYIRAQDKQKQFAAQGLLGTALTIALNILFLIPLKMGVVGYVLSVVVADLLVTVFLFLYNRLWRDIRRPDRPLVSALFKYSIPMIPTTVFWWVTNASDRYMVEYMVGEEANGLYSAAYKTPTLLILVSGIFIEAWNFSAVTEKKGRSLRDDPESREFFGIVFDSFQALIFMAGAGLIAFAKIITAILVDSSFYDSWQYIPILVAATVFSSLVTFMASVYLVEKKSVLSFLTAMVGAVLNVALNFLLIPSPISYAIARAVFGSASGSVIAFLDALGPNGAGIATFFSYFVVFIIRAISAKRLVNFNMHPLKLTVNTALITLQTVFMVAELPGWIPVVILCAVAIFAVNCKAILRGAMQVVSKGRRS